MVSSLGSDLPEVFDEDLLDKKDNTLDILDSEDSDLTLVIKEYWDDIQEEVKDYPIMRLYVAGLYKMASEYSRIEDQIDDMSTAVTDLGVSPQLTNERARIRDNMTSLTTEGWKLLNAVLDSLHKVQSTINKMKDKKGDEDPFESFFTES